jgi:hypothetical protein
LFLEWRRGREGGKEGWGGSIRIAKTEGPEEKIGKRKHAKTHSIAPIEIRSS